MDNGSICFISKGGIMDEIRIGDTVAFGEGDDPAVLTQGVVIVAGGGMLNGNLYVVSVNGETQSLTDKDIKFYKRAIQ